MSDPIVIVSRPVRPSAACSGISPAIGLGSWARWRSKAAVARAGVPGDAIDEVLMGCCLMAGQGQAPARCGDAACRRAARTRPVPSR